ncbi:MAG TPA: hypothetical protein VK588_11800 [Chitinophagaceae bacterium]|nr:hypothetical protein [Chitinophagaceae bacterium]
MAKESISELLRTLRRNQKKYLSFRGVHYVDIGYKYKNEKRLEKICLRFHVHKKLQKKFINLDAIPSLLHGIKTDIIVSNPIPQSRYGTSFTTLTGGIEIENPYEGSRGTLGAILLNSENRPVGLTNYHVLFGKNGQLNDMVVQPAKLQPPREDIVGIITGGTPQLDCACFIINNSRDIDRGIFQASANLANKLAPTHGLLVRKSGVATDVTYGLIDGIGADNSFSIVNHPVKANDGNILSSAGDSGSIWVSDSDPSLGVGLHFIGDVDGRRARAYDLGAVMIALSIHF